MPDGFHDAFAAALGGEVAALAPWWPDPTRGEAGLTVYRNTIAKGCADALAGLYPTVERIVGVDWFRAAALLYAGEAPPQRPSLLDYGESFADWLAGFAPARPFPYLPGIARLDRLWTEASLAADAEPLSPDAFDGLSSEDYFRLGATLHPSLRLAQFDTGIVSLWRALGRQAPELDEIALGEAPEAVLILRPGLEVEVHDLPLGGLVLLDACRAGASLAQAAALSIQADPADDLSILFARLIAAGCFIHLIPSRAPRP